MKIVVEAGRDAVDRAVYSEIVAAVGRRPAGVMGLSNGETLAGSYALLARALSAGELGAQSLRATHLCEYLESPIDRVGSDVHELMSACDPLRSLLVSDRFFAVPSDGHAGSIVAHERTIAELGGIDLQLVELGRDGRIGFIQPGTPFDRGFHRVSLPAGEFPTTGSRFRAGPVPTEGVTAGPRSLLSAGRLVVVAVGRRQARAVRSMVRGPVDPMVPARVVQYHANAVVYLDAAAAEELAERSEGES